MLQSKRLIIRCIVCVISLFLIVYYQRTTSVQALGMMVLGLAGLLWALYDYNKEKVSVDRKE